MWFIGRSLPCDAVDKRDFLANWLRGLWMILKYSFHFNKFYWILCFIKISPAKDFSEAKNFTDEQSIFN